MSTRKKTVPVVTYALLEKLSEKEKQREIAKEKPLATSGKGAVVIYTLLEKIQEKEKRREAEDTRHASEKEQIEACRKAREENGKHLAEKKALREKIRRTHVIPACVFAEKLAKRKEREKILKGIFLEQLEEKRLAEGMRRSQEEHISLMKKMHEKICREKVIPIEVKKLAQLFERSDITKPSLVLCEKPTVLIRKQFAQTIGFIVTTEERGDKTALTIKKPFSWHVL
ncbi:MAG: hypothetical protein WC878_01315 [Candidatus Paceibacterota bacterium]|jgi:hypothetical protein